MIEETRIASIVKREIENAVGGDTSETVQAREQAMDYYYNRERGDEKDGRSRIQSTDVADMTEAVMAQIMPAFCSDQIAYFSAVSANDTVQSYNEGAYCNYVFMELNQGYNILYQAVKDALLQKNGIVKVYVDERIHVTQKEYQGMSELEIYMALQPTDENEEVDASYDEENDILTVIRYRLERELVCDPIPPEDFIFTSDHNSINLQNIRFCGHRSIVSASDLVEQGFDEEIVATLEKYGTETKTGSTARNQTSAEGDHDSEHDSTRPIEVYECYIRLDIDEDGIAELRKIVISGSTILENVPFPFIPFAAGTGFLMPHRFLGLSMFDKMKMIQDSKTGFLRQYMDNADANNNRRLEIVEGQVNLEDVLNSRPGGVVRSKAPGMVNPIPVDDIGPSCINALNYFDKIRSERGGASLDMQSNQQDIPGAETAHGVERQYSVKEQLAAMITRTMAETLVSGIFLLIHATLREFFAEEYSANIDGQWVTMQPRTWLPRKRVSIKTGLTMGERLRQEQTLAATLSYQKEAMAGGLDGILVDETRLYNTVTDINRLSGVGSADRYWINPASDQAKKAKEQKQQSAQQESQAMKEQTDKIFFYQKQVEDAKRMIEMLREENKRIKESEANRLKLKMHNDKMRKDYTELELVHNKDIPGEGQ